MDALALGEHYLRSSALAINTAATILVAVLALTEGNTENESLGSNSDHAWEFSRRLPVGGRSVEPWFSKSKVHFTGLVLRVSAPPEPAISAS